MKAERHQIEAIVQRLESCISELRQIKEDIENCVEDRVEDFTQDDCLCEEAAGWLQSNEPTMALSTLKEIFEEESI